MTKRIPGRTLTALISIMAVWAATSCQRKPSVEQLPDYSGHDAVVHARGTLDNLSDSSQHQFDVWFDKKRQRFRSESSDGLLTVYQDGTAYQLPNGAPITQRSAQAMDFEAAVKQHLHVLRWVVDPSAHQDRPSLETESVKGIPASKKQVDETYYLWTDPTHRLLKIAPTDNSAAGALLSYEEFRLVAPNDVPAAALDVSVLPTMGPLESSYGESAYRPDHPEEMAAMFAMDDYDTFWLGFRYDGLTFSRGQRTVTQGYAVEMMAQGSGQDVSRMDTFDVIYNDEHNRVSGSGVSLLISSTPLSAFHTTLATIPGATSITLLDRTSTSAL